ncbi:hypothetical protein WI99_36550 [Burkholderia cepacia]|nr:hypothetical protein WI99_36550 [Burkholderia cepacia]
MNFIIFRKKSLKTFIDIRIEQILTIQPFQSTQRFVRGNMLKVLIFLIQKPDVVIFCVSTVFSGWEKDVVNDAFVLVSLSIHLLLAVQ